MFKLNHETLYLAVKLSDLYHSKKVVSRDEMQLIGATAVLISSKLHVRYFSLYQAISFIEILGAISTIFD